MIIINLFIENFSEKLKRTTVDLKTNKYTKNMEDAIANYRGAAEKTFSFTKPNSEFRKKDDELIGISK